eukprot:ctg_3596.g575
MSAVVDVVDRVVERGDVARVRLRGDATQGVRDAVDSPAGRGKRGGGGGGRRGNSGDLQRRRHVGRRTAVSDAQVVSARALFRVRHHPRRAGGEAGVGGAQARSTRLGRARERAQYPPR